MKGVLGFQDKLVFQIDDNRLHSILGRQTTDYTRKWTINQGYILIIFNSMQVSFYKLLGKHQVMQTAELAPGTILWLRSLTWTDRTIQCYRLYLIKDIDAINFHLTHRRQFILSMSSRYKPLCRTLYGSSFWTVELKNCFVVRNSWKEHTEYWTFSEVITELTNLLYSWFNVSSEMCLF